MLKLLAAAGIGAGLLAAFPLVKDRLPFLAGEAEEQGGATPPPAAPVQVPPATAAPAIPAQGRVVPQSKSDAISSYAPVVRRASPAVVNVYARTVQRGRVGVDFFGGAFRLPDRQSQSQGSGVIVRDDGVVVTNNHVVENATELMVVLCDRREFPAKVVLTDPRTDLAVLRIEATTERLPSLRFADTTNAQVGDQVLAIGNPFGVGQTVTSGIISALARTDVGITDYSFFIQTDASINPGNSGGALVDMNGDLVGVNTAIFSRSGTSAGVGFAIPAEMVRRVVEGAVTDGRVVRAWAGVRGQTVDAEMARTLSLPKPGGVLVTEVWPGSAAAQAGVRRGDVIVSLAGTEVNDESGLRYLAATQRPGTTVAIDFLRQGARITGRGTVAPPPEGRDDTRQLEGRHSFDGVTLATITPAIAEEQGLDPFAKGVVVKGVDTRREGARAGLRPGDIVLEINDEPVTTVADLAGKLRGGRQGRVTIQRGDRRISAVLFL